MIERLQSQWAQRANRNPASLTGAAYRSDGSWLRVHMTNLSYDGCLIISDGPLDVGETITLVMPRMRQMKAQVRWTRDIEAGLRFLQDASAVDNRRARIGV